MIFCLIYFHKTFHSHLLHILYFIQEVTHAFSKNWSHHDVLLMWNVCSVHSERQFSARHQFTKRFSARSWLMQMIQYSDSQRFSFLWNWIFVRHPMPLLHFLSLLPFLTFYHYFLNAQGKDMEKKKGQAQHFQWQIKHPCLLWNYYRVTSINNQLFM